MAKDKLYADCFLIAHFSSQYNAKELWIWGLGWRGVTARLRGMERVPVAMAAPDLVPFAFRMEVA